MTLNFDVQTQLHRIYWYSSQHLVFCVDRSFRTLSKLPLRISATFKWMSQTYSTGKGTLFRIVHHTTREHSGWSSTFRLNTPSSLLGSPSKRKSTIPTSTRRVRSACQSSVPKTGSQPQKLTKSSRP